MRVIEGNGVVIVFHEHFFARFRRDITVAPS
jgi:hypothetical protein